MYSVRHLKLMCSAPIVEIFFLSLHQDELQNVSIEHGTFVAQTVTRDFFSQSIFLTFNNVRINSLLVIFPSSQFLLPFCLPECRFFLSFVVPIFSAESPLTI